MVVKGSVLSKHVYEGIDFHCFIISFVVKGFVFGGH